MMLKSISLGPDFFGGVGAWGQKSASEEIPSFFLCFLVFSSSLLKLKKKKILILGRFLSKQYLFFPFFFLRERGQNTNYLGLGSGDNKIKQGCSDLAGRWRSAFTIESLAFQNS